MSIKTRRLGKGLEAVLSAQATVAILESNPATTRAVEEIAMARLTSGKYQPRNDFDQVALAELADSIREHGVIQPIIARQRGDNFEIVAGERRWRAAQMAGLATIPVLICTLDDQSTLAFALIENIQRQDLNAIEAARAYHRLINEFALTHEQVAKVVGKSRPAISNMLRLLNMPEPVQQLLSKGEIEVGHAKLLLTLPEQQQIAAANTIIMHKLTVRATEALVDKYTHKPVRKPRDPEHQQLLQNWQQQLAKKWQTQVAVKIATDGKGKIVLEFDSLEEIASFIDATTHGSA